MKNNLMIQSDYDDNGNQYWFIWDYVNNDFYPSQFLSFDSYELALSYLNQVPA